MRHASFLACGFAAQLAFTTIAFAQIGNGNVGGIRIDADGVIGLAIQHDRGGKLDNSRRAALARQAVAGDVARSSDQRQVSLVRLESACAERLARREPLPPEINCLAGLTQIDHVFVDPDGNDVILSGPAEPFAQAESGRWIGLESGRPVLLLDDLIVALRAAATPEPIGCSIDPNPDRLAEFQRYSEEAPSRATPAVIERRYRRMVEILGNYEIRIFGVPHDSQFARGLVEADFRMKLLTLGLEKPGVKGFQSHLAMLDSSRSLHRWWFVPLYDAILKSDDGLAYEFAGPRAQLLGEDELANAEGERLPAATTKASTLDYSQQFTETFPQLAERMPVFARLQQLIDWTVLAALVRHEGLAERVGWSMPLFSDSQKLPHETWPVPKQAPCLFNRKVRRGGSVLAEFAGGVSIRPIETLRTFSRPGTADNDLARERTQALQRSDDDVRPWWWD